MKSPRERRENHPNSDSPGSPSRRWTPYTPVPNFGDPLTPDKDPRFKRSAAPPHTHTPAASLTARGPLGGRRARSGDTCPAPGVRPCPGRAWPPARAARCALLAPGRRRVCAARRLTQPLAQSASTPPSDRIGKSLPARGLPRPSPPPHRRAHRPADKSPGDKSLSDANTSPVIQRRGPGRGEGSHEAPSPFPDAPSPPALGPTTHDQPRGC